MLNLCVCNMPYADIYTFVYVPHHKFILAVSVSVSLFLAHTRFLLSIRSQFTSSSWFSFFFFIPQCYMRQQQHTKKRICRTFHHFQYIYPPFCTRKRKKTQTNNKKKPNNKYNNTTCTPQTNSCPDSLFGVRIYVPIINAFSLYQFNYSVRLFLFTFTRFMRTADDFCFVWVVFLVLNLSQFLSISFTHSSRTAF